MRVLHVVRQFHPSVGGLEDFVLSLARQQLREGLQAEVVTLNRTFRHPSVRLPSAELVDGVLVRRIGYIGSYKYPIAPDVLRGLSKFDLVHVHGIDFFCDYLAITRVLHGRPLVVSTHGGFFHTAYAKGLKNLFFLTITRLSLTQYRRVLANSSNDWDIFRPITRKNLVLIENGVNTNKFKNCGAQTFSPSFAYIGRLSLNKGLAELIDTFDIVCASVPSAHLEIIGNDFDGLLEVLQLRIAASGNSDKIKIRTGLSNNEIKQVIRDCSFFISASKYEGFGQTLVEAMSAGLIPIVNRIKSFEAIVTKSSVGMLTDFSRPAVAARQIVEFVSQAKSDYELMKNRAVTGSEWYSWEHASKRFSQEYERVLGVNARTLLGVRLEAQRREEAVSTIDQAVDQGRSLRIAFANAHTLNIATKSQGFRDVLERFLVFNDGVGVDIASRFKFGRGFSDNINGTDFVPHFLLSTKHSFRIFLIGSTNQVVSRAAEEFSGRFPQHRIVGFRDGFFIDAADVQRTCRLVRESGADLLLVGMGNPLQELWIDQNGEATGAKLMFGVGALFDFISGEKRRAPLWVRKIRGEWMYRLLLEPRRLWRRYLVGNFVFIKNVLFE